MPAEVKQTGPCNQQIIGQRFEFGGGTLVPNKPLECKLQLGQVHLDGHVFTLRILQCLIPTFRTEYFSNNEGERGRRREREKECTVQRAIFSFCDRWRMRNNRGKFPSSSSSSAFSSSSLFFFCHSEYLSLPLAHFSSISQRRAIANGGGGGGGTEN